MTFLALTQLVLRLFERGDVHSYQANPEQLTHGVSNWVDAHEMVARRVTRRTCAAQLTVYQRLGCLEYPGYERPDGRRIHTAGVRQRTSEKRLDWCSEHGGEGIV